ncbi:AI-2E family transporter [Anatilimnocola sp. NA78]|uniref:AI-2E family transporter n=1 Tax=Anatilimnocola sp. NA78 TaxID=3415683 RepID=UPI003CE48F9D
MTFTKHSLVVAVTLLALVTLWGAGTAIAIFLTSLVVAAALHPPVEYLKRRGFGSAMAAGLVAGLCALVLGALICMIAPQLLHNLNDLQADVSTAIASFAERSPNHWAVQLTKNQEGDPTLPMLGGLLPSLIGTASNLFQLSAFGGICLALSFYWTLDRERFERLWLSLVPVRRRVGTQRMWQAMEREVGAYLRSEIIQFLLAVYLLWIVFMVLDLRYAAFVAIAAGTLTLIPWLGTLFASAVVLVLTSPKLVDLDAPWVTTQGWLALVAILLVLILLEFVVEPKLFQRDRYNSLWIALAAIVMTFLWGFWGLIFGPMVGYVLQILVRQAYPRLVQEQSPISSSTALVDRVAQLEARFAAAEEVPPELLSLKQRLLDLVEQHREIAKPEMSN